MTSLIRGAKGCKPYDNRTSKENEEAESTQIMDSQQKLIRGEKEEGDGGDSRKWKRRGRVDVHGIDGCRRVHQKPSTGFGRRKNVLGAKTRGLGTEKDRWRFNKSNLSDVAKREWLLRGGGGEIRRRQKGKERKDRFLGLGGPIPHYKREILFI